MTDAGSQRVESGRRLPAAVLWLTAVSLVTVFGSSPVHAQRIENGVAVFAALDKVTAKISRLEIKLGDTTRFGALKVTPRACYSRSPTEPPKTTSFVEVDEVQLDGKEERIFNGWMFAESPGLNAVEHPVYDVWLTECLAPQRGGVAQKGPDTSQGRGQPPSGTDASQGEFRRRPRR